MGGKGRCGDKFWRFIKRVEKLSLSNLPALYFHIGAALAKLNFITGILFRYFGFN